MLTPIREDWTIVLVGHWNISIFSPAWLTQHVFEERELVVEYPIDPGFPRRITGAEVRIIPMPDRVVLNPVQVSDSVLAKMETFACALLLKLQHTPISASGVNFGFKYEGDDREEIITSHFPSQDDSFFSERGMRPKDRTLTRSLDWDGWVLNMKTLITHSELRFDFNFHADTPNAEISQKKIAGNVFKLKVQAEQILKDIYHLARE
jgi:hypothetical protein